MRMSWEVLKLDKELVAFPIFSAVGIGIITVPFALLFFAVIQESGNNVVFYLTVFIYLVLTNSVAVFLKGGTGRLCHHPAAGRRSQCQERAAPCAAAHP